uniref:Uncharacterized protein n=1 Tax=Amphimedon queenslandica TaxID=400682 RepID=A0A1X7V7W1_AMPQE
MLTISVMGQIKYMYKRKGFHKKVKEYTEEAIKQSRNGTRVTDILNSILMIANLPPVQRALPKNLILARLWFAKEKPNMGHFLKYIIKNIQSLDKGFQVTTDENEDVTVSGKIFALIADPTARANILNMSQFNAYSSCSFCHHPGVSVATGN